MTNYLEVQEKASRTDALIIFGYKVVSRLAKIVPSVVVEILALVLVPAVCVLMRKQRPIVARNLKRVDPALGGLKLRRAVRRSFESYARYFIETFRLPALSKKVIDSRISVEGFEHIENALILGKGVILALPHLGGWEWSGRWLIHQGHSLHAVVEKLDSEALFKVFVDLREDFLASLLERSTFINARGNFLGEVIGCPACFFISVLLPTKGCICRCSRAPNLVRFTYVVATIAYH